MRIKISRKRIGYLVIPLIAQCCCAGAFAQNAVFLKEGRIVFEKRVNSYALMKEMSDVGAIGEDKLADYKSKNAQFKLKHCNLYFGGDKTLFGPVKEDSAGAYSIDEWFSMVADANVVYSDLPAGRRVSQKQVFGNSYLITDSIRRIKWKITDETREIAGMQCRRADAIVNDSVYVVAFYASEIPVSGGPESFSGLPGMILGLALPAEHITWFATSVFSKDLPAAGLTAPSSGKSMAGRAFYDFMIQATKGWNNAGALIMRKALL
jgi:GLPGLI family protein